MNSLFANPAGANAKRVLRGGATLIEVLLSIGIAMILLAATVSMLFVAQRAVASGADAASRLAEESWAMQIITTDLSLAVAFSERTDKAVTVIVPDRTGDGQNETIRYAWSGVPGDPLTRQINGGAATVLAASVYQFKLAYLLKTLSPQARLIRPDARRFAHRPTDDEMASRPSYGRLPPWPSARIAAA